MGASSRSAPENVGASSEQAEDVKLSFSQRITRTANSCYSVLGFRACRACCNGGVHGLCGWGSGDFMYFLRGLEDCHLRSRVPICFLSSLQSYATGCISESRWCVAVACDPQHLPDGHGACQVCNRSLWDKLFPGAVWLQKGSCIDAFTSMRESLCVCVLYVCI